MIRWLFCALLLLIPLTLRAGPMLVTSGEHDGFTRLVITLPHAQDWQLGRMQDGYRLSLPDATEDYDLSKVGDRIGRTRLAEVRQLPDSSDLRIVAACACHATAFAFQPDIIVVDVKSGPPPAGSPFEHALEQPLPRPVPLPQTPALALGWNMRQTGGIRPMVTPDRAPRELGRDLARQIGTAASSGLIELAVPEADGAGDPSLPQIELRAEPNLEMHIGERDTTAILQPDCPAPEEYIAENWIPAGTTAAGFLQKVAQVLASDIDDPPPSDLMLAAKLYLHFGFGTEARQLLQQLPASEEYRAGYIAISQVMDGDPADPDPFADLAHCRSAVALWAILARPHLRPAEPIASNDIYQAFANLPRHLRHHLVGPLIDRLREQGDLKAADRIRAAIERETRLTEPGFDLALGRLQIAEQEENAARATLEKAAATPGIAEAEALIALVKLAFDNRTPIQPARLQNIAALEAQFAAAPLGLDLRHALVIAYALSGEFQSAAQILRSAPSAKDRFWTLLAERGTAADLLDLAFTPPGDAAHLIRPEGRLRIAKQLATLGFHAEAAQWLLIEGAAAPPVEDARQLALAEAYLALHRPKDALASLAGSSPQADDLRARALVALDRKGEAALLLPHQPPSETMRHLFRREGDWSRVAATDSALWADAAKAYLTARQLPVDDMTLAVANEALDVSVQNRAIVAKLLAGSAVSAPSAETSSATTMAVP
ncbi:hypothetical protein [Gemmobacter serpentinus]|uniref:hypothetical protein n=1 Tax=Gemmobacter serpentinus TaxID=2652247 RepID=UPI00124D6441|nr:hypothetical protein [Gemmobacter serpentinus]